MAIFTWILFFVVFLSIIGGIALLLREKYSEPEYISDTVVKCFMPQYADNNFKGRLLHIDTGTERDGIIFIPKNNYRRDNQGKLIKLKEEKRRPITVFVKKDLIYHFPKGTLSADEHELWLLPPAIEELPEVFRNTPFGATLVKMISDKENQKTVIEILRKQGEVKDKLLKRLEGLDLVEEYINTTDELSKDFYKKIIEGSGSRDKSSIGTDFSHLNK